MNEKQRLLNEDLKRFKLLMEYDFYIGEDESEDAELLFDEEGEEAPEGDDPFGGEAPEGDAPEGEEMPEDGEEEPMGDDMEGDLPPPEPMDGDMEDDMGGEEPMPEEPMEDEVELDVTELVQGTEEAKAAADQATATANQTNQQITQLMSRFDELSQSLDRMDAINAKIHDIEHEIETRNPLPNEKLEMRSMDSFPYNLKLTDYWAEKEGHYDAMGGNKEKEEEKEYVLTQDDVNRDYNAMEIKDSFSSDDDTDPIRY